MAHFKQLLKLAAAGTFIVGGALSQAASAEDNVSQEKAFKDLVSYLTGPVRFWTQENENFTEGGDQPKYWLSTFKSGPGGQSVLSEAYAVSSDDSCQLLSHFDYYFDAENQSMNMAATLGNGMHNNSELIYTEEGTYVLEITIKTPNGDLIMKDTTTFSDANTRKSQAEIFNSETGGWDMRDAAYWNRASSEFTTPCD